MPAKKKEELALEPQPGDIVGEDKEAKVVYVIHPVALERKKELRAKGLKIIDAKFKD